MRSCSRATRRRPPTCSARMRRSSRISRRCRRRRASTRSSTSPANRSRAGSGRRRRRQLLLGSRLGVTRSVARARRSAGRQTEDVGQRLGNRLLRRARRRRRAAREVRRRAAVFKRSCAGAGRQTAARAAELGVKVTALRIGVVLGDDGGALPALARPVRLFAGTGMGTGRQWFSWIHVDDLVEAVLFVLDQETLAGPLNATAPEPVRHDELMATMAAQLHRPLWPLRIPASALRWVLGRARGAVRRRPARHTGTVAARSSFSFATRRSSRRSSSYSRRAADAAAGGERQRLAVRSPVGIATE